MTYLKKSLVTSTLISGMWSWPLIFAMDCSSLFFLFLVFCTRKSPPPPRNNIQHGHESGYGAPAAVSSARVGMIPLQLQCYTCSLSESPEVFFYLF